MRNWRNVEDYGERICHKADRLGRAFDPMGQMLFLFLREMKVMKRTRYVGVVLYNKVDTLDFTGPHDVFGVAGFLGSNFQVFTVAEKETPLTTVSGITITPQYSFDTCPAIDILIVPGGWELAQKYPTHD